jgi:allantoinase
VRDAKRRGLDVTCEVTPHHLALTDEACSHYDTRTKVMPPLRTTADQEALLEALADGTIDCIVSDHSPCTPELKRLDLGDFGEAWGGISSLQLGLPAIWTEARQRGHRLSDVIRWMAEHPAAQAGLQRKGAIAVGNDADFAVFAPDETMVVDPNLLYHKNAVTPYAGRTLTGQVRSTWLGGTDISGDVESNGDRRGRLLRRGEA